MKLNPFEQVQTEFGALAVLSQREAARPELVVLASEKLIAILRRRDCWNIRVQDPAIDPMTRTVEIAAIADGHTVRWRLWCQKLQWLSHAYGPRRRRYAYR